MILLQSSSWKLVVKKKEEDKRHEEDKNRIQMDDHHVATGLWFFGIMYDINDAPMSSSTSQCRYLYYP